MSEPSAGTVRLITDLFDSLCNQNETHSLQNNYTMAGE